MYRGAVKKTALILATSTVILNSKDVVNSDSSEKSWIDKLKTSFYGDNENVPTAAPVLKTKDNLTGWDRLTIMYTRDEYGNISKELNAVLYSLYTSVLAGGIYGTLLKTKEAHREFIERNQATQFANILEARRKMQDKVFLAGLKGAFKYAMKLGFFSGGILCCSISMMVYFDKTSVLFYGISAGTLGALHRWKFGLKGMYIGGVIGGLLGLIAGGLTKGLFLMTGKSLDDIMTYQEATLQIREKQGLKIIKEHIDNTNEYLPLLKDHETIVDGNKAEETSKVEPDKKNSAET